MTMLLITRVHQALNLSHHAECWRRSRQAWRKRVRRSSCRRRSASPRRRGSTRTAPSRSAPDQSRSCNGQGRLTLWPICLVKNFCCMRWTCCEMAPGRSLSRWIVSISETSFLNWVNLSDYRSASIIVQGFESVDWTWTRICRRPTRCRRRFRRYPRPGPASAGREYSCWLDSSAFSVVWGSFCSAFVSLHHRHVELSVNKSL